MSALLKAQPKALYLLFFTQMWECFSFYGMRVLLVLYMIHELGYGDEKAFGIYAAYTALVECGGVFGGIIADRVLGFRKAIFLGGVIIVLGHLSMSIPLNPSFFFLGLGLIIVGTSLFRTNITALLGLFYEENDPRREVGYTTFFIGINVGGLIAALLCGYVGENLGWHYGFGLAALGMFLGNFIFFMFKNILEDKGERKFVVSKFKEKTIFFLILLMAPLCAYFLNYSFVVMILVPILGILCICFAVRQVMHCSLIEKKQLIELAGYIILLMTFFAFEEQLGSSLVLFNDRFVNKEIWNFQIPTASLVMINPLVIMSCGGIISKLFEKLYKRGAAFSPRVKIGIAFCLIGLAFAILYLGTSNAQMGQVHVMYVIGCFAAIALGELFVAPAVNEFCAKVSPKHLQGLMMGMVTLGYSFANILSGFLSQRMALPHENLRGGLIVYQEGFLQVIVISMSLSCLLLVICPLFHLKKLGRVVNS